MGLAGVVRTWGWLGCGIRGDFLLAEDSRDRGDTCSPGLPDLFQMLQAMTRPQASSEITSQKSGC